jgi:hypothetical protein
MSLWKSCVESSHNQADSWCLSSQLYPFGEVARVQREDPDFSQFNQCYRVSPTESALGLVVLANTELSNILKSYPQLVQALRGRGVFIQVKQQ